MDLIPIDPESMVLLGDISIHVYVEGVFINFKLQGERLFIFTTEEMKWEEASDDENGPIECINYFIDHYKQKGEKPKFYMSIEDEY